MAGLQYNFFPTDFFYPRTESVPSDVTRKAAAAVAFPAPKTESAAADDKPMTAANKGAVSMRRGEGRKDQQKGVKISKNSVPWTVLNQEDFSGSS
ncbi:hypothetical protein SLA2020_470080 [Shorea laevis]